MASNVPSRILQKVARHAVTGKGAHAATIEVFSGLDWKTAGTRRRGAPHSLYQLLNHMRYWQDWVVHWLDGENPAIPKHASESWPGKVAPSNRREWQDAVTAFRRGVAELERRSRDANLLSGPSRKSRLEMLQTIGAHNSYHAGQAVLLRQLFGKWPPPSGGLTW
jgi:uncharacterized damage-inducible protein DinB